MQGSKPDPFMPFPRSGPFPDDVRQPPSETSGTGPLLLGGSPVAPFGPGRRPPARCAAPRVARPGLPLTIPLAPLLPVDSARAEALDLCLRPAHGAARLTGVPPAAPSGIALTETGGRQEGEARPCAADMAGEGHWSELREAALALATARHAQGAKGFPLGGVRINWRRHPEESVTIGQMSGPPANAACAVRFLERRLSAGAGAFRTPEPAARDRTVLDAHHATALANGPGRDRLSGPPAPSGALLAQGGAPAPGLPGADTLSLLRGLGGTARPGTLSHLGDG